MSQNAIPSVGTVLKVGDGATPEVFTAIGEVISITPFNGSTETLDASDISSVFRAKKAGLRDWGQLQFTVHLLPDALSAHAALVSDWKNGNDRNFQIVYPDTDQTTQQIETFITGVSPTVQMGQTIQCSFTAEVNDVTDVA